MSYTAMESDIKSSVGNLSKQDYYVRKYELAR